jgi:hypothetical protein
MAAFVEIPLNSFRYRFRRLTWQEEFKIPFSATEDQRIALLSHAMVSISGMLIASLADAKKILAQVPPAILWRIWVVYRANLPADRYYVTRGLYEAPDQRAHMQRVFEDEEADAPQTGLDTESREAMAISNRLVANAKQTGKLVKASRED